MNKEQAWHMIPFLNKFGGSEKREGNKLPTDPPFGTEAFRRAHLEVEKALLLPLVKVVLWHGAEMFVRSMGLVGGLAYGWGGGKYRNIHEEVPETVGRVLKIPIRETAPIAAIMRRWAGSPAAPSSRLESRRLEDSVEILSSPLFLPWRKYGGEAVTFGIGNTLGAFIRAVWSGDELASILRMLDEEYGETRGAALTAWRFGRGQAYEIPSAPGRTVRIACDDELAGEHADLLRHWRHGVADEHFRHARSRPERPLSATAGLSGRVGYDPRETWSLLRQATDCWQKPPGWPFAIHGKRRSDWGSEDAVDEAKRRMRSAIKSRKNPLLIEFEGIDKDVPAYLNPCCDQNKGGWPLLDNGADDLSEATAAWWRNGLSDGSVKMQNAPNGGVFLSRLGGLELFHWFNYVTPLRTSHKTWRSKLGERKGRRIAPPPPPVNEGVGEIELPVHTAMLPATPDAAITPCRWAKERYAERNIRCLGAVAMLIRGLGASEYKAIRWVAEVAPMSHGALKAAKRNILNPENGHPIRHLIQDLFGFQVDEQ